MEPIPVRNVIRTVLRGTVEPGATTPILPEDGSTMQVFLLRIKRRYTQMGLEPREWGNALLDHLVGPALTYWMYLRRTSDLATGRQYSAGFWSGLTEQCRRVNC